jgi:hypothetical protein
MSDHKSAPSDESNPYQVLAEQGDISIYRCDQGCLHLQFGNINLRLEDDEFENLVAVISAAARKNNGPLVMKSVKYGRVQ